MQQRTPEQNFARFRDQADLPALALVFDALAGHLLLIAGHLVRDGALAEDLVQTTFVEAMRGAQSYDTGRPLLPWLVQILTNQSRKMRRQRNRPDDPRPHQDPMAMGPDQQVLQQEFAAAVERALQRLPSHHRQVLTLRLVHDLSPTAIAHALGCPPDTVKTRLRRGLKALRQQLPSGLVPMLALSLANGRGLAAVRADVLLHANGLSRAAPAKSLAAVALGAMVMKLYAVRATVLALLMVLAWVAVEDWRPEPERPGDEVPDTGSAEQAVVPVAPPMAPDRRLASAADADQASVVFTGRCLQAGTGRPLPGVNAVAIRLPASGSGRLLNELGAADVLGSASSDDEGRFLLACAPGDEDRIRVQVGTDRLQLRWAGFGPFAHSHRHDLGDIPMSEGVCVTTRVVDRRGQPVGGVALSIALEAAGGRTWEALPAAVGFAVRSGSDGTIRWPAALRPGRWSVDWLGDAFPEDRQGGQILVPPNCATHDHELLCPVEDVRRAIRGLVVDANGEPVADMDLMGVGAGTRGYARTAWDGRFVMPRIGPYDEALLGPVTLWPADPLCGQELKAASDLRWGAADLTLVLRPVQCLDLRVLDSRTGQPLSDWLVSSATVDPETGGPFQMLMPRSKQLACGSRRLEVPRIPLLLQIVPSDRGLCPHLLAWAPGGEGSLTVALESTRMVEIRVVTESRVPVVGSKVWTLLPIEAGADGLGAATGDTEPPVEFALGLDPVTRADRYGIGDAVLDHGTTDATGCVRLRVPRHGTALISAVGDHVPRATVVMALADQTDFVVRRGGAVRFELTPPELLARFVRSDGERLADEASALRPQRLQLSVTPMARTVGVRQSTVSVEAALRGPASRCAGLLPGSYQASAYGSIASEFGDISLCEELGTVEVADGAEVVVPVDLRRFVPGRMKGQIIVNGEPLAFHEAHLEALLPDGSPSSTTVEIGTDAEGRFQVDMVPGPVRCHLRSAFDHSTFWCATELCEVVSGRDTEVVFDVRRVTARVQLVAADGSPAAGFEVRMQCADEPRDRRAWLTDGDGRVTIDPSPLSAFHLLVGPVPGHGAAAVAAADHVLGPLQVANEGNRVELQLHLPARR